MSYRDENHRFCNATRIRKSKAGEHAVTYTSCHVLDSLLPLILSYFLSFLYISHKDRQRSSRSPGRKHASSSSSRHHSDHRHKSNANNATSPEERGSGSGGGDKSRKQRSSRSPSKDKKSKKKDKKRSKSPKEERSKERDNNASDRGELSRYPFIA